LTVIIGRVPFDELVAAQVIKKFPAFYTTRKFITVIREACHWSLSRVRQVHFTHSHFLFKTY